MMAAKNGIVDGPRWPVGTTSGDIAPWALFTLKCGHVLSVPMILRPTAGPNWTICPHIAGCCPHCMVIEP